MGRFSSHSPNSRRRIRSARRCFQAMVATSPGFTAIYGGCAGQSSTPASMFLGLTTTPQLRCLALGVYTVSLIDIAGEPNFGTTLLDTGANNIPTTVGDPITVTCAPPASPTSTATSTATPTATPTPPLPAIDGIAKDTGIRPDENFSFSAGNL